MLTSKKSMSTSLTAGLAFALAVALAAPADGQLAADQAPGRSGTQPVRSAPKVPGLATKVVMGDLDVPWDIAELPDRSWLVTERDRLTILLRKPDGSRITLANDPAGFWASGETGMLSIVADPKVAGNNRFYTCSGFRPQGRNPQIRVYAWRLNNAHTSARRLGPLLTGIQITSGRHGGCRLRFDPMGRLYVGTGDSAVGTNPQNLHSLNGKLLRLNRFTGKPSPANPFIHAANRKKRYIYNYGHRNVQGLAWRPGDRMWSIEHGTDRNDEINRAVAGGNYGWNPVPGYDESTPMTDFSLPGRQIAARWRSGYPTIATSGAVFVRGKEWGAYQGALAVCALAGSKLLFMKFTREGRLLWVKTPPSLNGDFGRLRSVVQVKTGALLVTTSNGGGGGGGDRIVRVTPR